MPQRVPRRAAPVRLLAHAVLFVLTFACLCGPARAAEPVAGTAPPKPAAADSAPANAVATTTLHDVVVELGRTDALQREIAATLRETSNWKVAADRLADPALAADLRTLEQERETLLRLRYLELIDADTRLRERVSAATDATRALSQLTRKVEDDLVRVDHEVARWPQRAALAREREAPAEVQRQADAAGTRVAELRDRLRARRDELLVAYAQGVELQSRLDTVRAKVAERRERISAELRDAEDVPIWKERALAMPHEEIVAALRLARIELVDYLREHGGRVGALFVALGALIFLMLRRPSPAASQEPSRRIPAGVAFVAALLGSVVLVAVLAPRAPFVFYRLVGIATPLLAGIVATRSFAAPIPATAWTLILGEFVNGFRLLAGMSPAAERLLLAVQILPVAVALVHDWRRGALARFLPGWPAVRIRRLVQAELLAIGAIVVASVLGYGGIAGPLAVLAVVLPGFALIVTALAWTLDRACDGLLSTPLAQNLRSVRERKDTILRTVHKVVVLFCLALGTLSFTLAHSAFDTLLQLGQRLTQASVTVGDVTITAAAVLSALLVVASTWLVTKLVRFVLDHEILPRLNLRTGVPIAISTIVGYVLVLTGFVLAMAALGIDLTKVTLLAGALGVGVGLGLQSVVSNFASGLILMLERPINVGDEIDVGGVGGEVKRIGVRSSTIRTSQGAEVIIPNSDLASKQVTNWTLSDRARRYEIDVGVAYGSDPTRVLRLLEEAVANLPEVQKVPPPRALFRGFGDSSLDFRLSAWVPSIDIGTQAQNSMRVAILRTLDQAGIEIPFPQRDLRIRHAPAKPGPQGLDTPG